MIELKFTGANPEEVFSKMRAMLGFTGGSSAAPAPLSATGKLTKDDVTAAWTVKKTAGFVGADLLAALSTLGAKKISELKDDQFAAAITAINALTAPAKPKATTEDDLRNAWAAKKEKGFVGADLLAVLGGFVIGQNPDDNEDIVAKKISELKPEQYNDALKALNALTKA